MPKLEIKTNGDARTIDLSKPQITIGRQEGNDVVLADPAASRKHCVIQQTDDGYQIKDLGSHNGTWLGENRILEAEMGYGESIRIGGTYLTLISDYDEPRDAMPVADVIVEEDEEEELPIPRGSMDRSTVKSTLMARALAAGPLSKQLGPLLQACVNVPQPPGAPESVKDLRLLNKKSEPVGGKGDTTVRHGEPFEAVKQLLFAAFRTRGTDIHIEPKAEVYTIRFRIDGILHAVGEVTEKMGVAILNVFKILSMADIAKRNIVQEGNFAVELPTRRVDFRMNLTPTLHGQKLALRLLDKGSVPTHFENLGMDLRSVAELSKTCEQDSGMVIIAGPTGSGKTTTLYTALLSLDATTRNIITIEDPVEYALPNTTQISIDPVHNLTFGSVLSSILRQDPDVILVGEVRDQETAKLAMQAATTGHLVLTTIHARDTIGTVFRLLDLGVEPFLISSALTMCITQRLIRVLCPNCKRAFRPDAKVIRQMKLEGRPYGEFFDAVGCKACMGTGYRGRMAIFEMLMFTPQVRDVILSSPTVTDIRKAAGEWMFHTLVDSGYQKVIEGVTTVQEVERVAGTF
jgi:general secretion pathway protein E